MALEPFPKVLPPNPQLGVAYETARYTAVPFTHMRSCVWERDGRIASGCFDLSSFYIPYGINWMGFGFI